MNGTLTQNPDFKVFEEELKQSPSKIQNIVGKLLSKKSPKAPIKVNKEHHTTDQVQNLIKYNEVLGYFGGKIPDNLKETWENLNKRPNITQEDYDKLKNSKDKEGKPIELTEEEKEAIKNYKEVKSEKDKLGEKIKELEKRPTQEQLNQAVQEEKNKHQGEVEPTEYNKLKEEKDKLVEELKTRPTKDDLDKANEKVKELEKRPTKEQLDQAVQQEKDKGGISSEGEKKLKEDLDKWTAKFPNKTPQEVFDNQEKHTANDLKPTEATNEDKELGIDGDNEESISKRKLISEIRRLTNLFGEKELDYRKVEVHFGNDKSKLGTTNDGNIHLLLDQKDKNSKWSDKLVLWSFVQELTHEFIILKKKEEYSKEFNLRFSPLFWKHFLYEDKSIVKWINENINPDYKDLVLLSKPSTLPKEFGSVEVSSVYFDNSDLDKAYQDLTGKGAEGIILDGEEITATNRWLDDSWLIIGKELMELTRKEIDKGLKKEETIKLWTKLIVSDYNSDSKTYTLKISYHKDSPFQGQIEQLIVTPLKLEAEYLRKEKGQLPTNENYTKLLHQKQEWKKQLHDSVGEDKYNEIVNKVENIN